MLPPTKKRQKFNASAAFKFNYKSFVKIKNDHINITISSDEHNTEIANKVIKKVQDLYENRMYITVKFQK